MEAPKEPRILRSALPRVRADRRGSTVHLALEEGAQVGICGVDQGVPMIDTGAAISCPACVHIARTIQAARKVRPLK